MIPFLTLLLFVPLLGALLILLIPKKQEGLIKAIAVIFSLPSLLIALWLGATYDDSGTYYAAVTERADWIPAIGVEYHLGVDGLSIPMIILTTLLTTPTAFSTGRVIRVSISCGAVPS